MCVLFSGIPENIKFVFECPASSLSYVRLSMCLVSISTVVLCAKFKLACKSFISECYDLIEFVLDGL